MSKEELVDVIKEAFYVRTYDKILTPERAKEVTVKVSALQEI